MTSDSFASVMLGLGSYAPELRLTNEELSQRMDTSDEWIVQRTGIHELGEFQGSLSPVSPAPATAKLLT